MGKMTSSEESRLDRIESKIDKMSDAIIALARAEEKIAVLMQLTSDLTDRMEGCEENIGNIEQAISSTECSLRSIKAVWWLFLSAIVSSGVAAIFYYLQ